MKDPNNNEDEDTHADQCDGRQQHAVAGSKVQFSAPTKKEGRKRDKERKIAICCFMFCNSLIWQKNNAITKNGGH